MYELRSVAYNCSVVDVAPGANTGVTLDMICT